MWIVHFIQLYMDSFSYAYFLLLTERLILQDINIRWIILFNGSNDQMMTVLSLSQILFLKQIGYSLGRNWIIENIRLIGCSLGNLDTAAVALHSSSVAPFLVHCADYDTTLHQSNAAIACNVFSWWHMVRILWRQHKIRSRWPPQNFLCRKNPSTSSILYIFSNSTLCDQDGGHSTVACKSISHI